MQTFKFSLTAIHSLDRETKTPKPLVTCVNATTIGEAEAIIYKWFDQVTDLELTV